MRAELDGLPCTVVVNPDHAQGVGTSLQTGVRQVAADVDALVVVLADMPLVTAGMIATLAERHRATGAPVVASYRGDVQAPPTLYARALFEERLQVPDVRGGKEVVRRHQAEAVVVRWPEGTRRDIDVPDDHEGVRLT